MGARVRQILSDGRHGHARSAASTPATTDFLNQAIFSCPLRMMRAKNGM
jgi:hypothetical protein